MTQDRVGDDLELLLAVLAEVERGVDLAERAHGFFAELEELVDLPPDLAIRDRGKQPGKGRVLGRFGLQTTKDTRRRPGDRVGRDPVVT